MGEDNVLNTELRFDDEFVRHKILDIIGDLYLPRLPKFAAKSPRGSQATATTSSC